MISQPDLNELLAPFKEPDDDLMSRRVQVDREKIVSRMVEVSLTPEERFSLRARSVAIMAMAAGFALAAWGGARLLHRGSQLATHPTIEIVAVRGVVSGVQDGMLETSEGAEARIKTSQGLEIDLLESTKVSLAELGASNVSSAVRLERGRVRCVIPHQPGRTFAVVTKAARIIDIGTTFSVSVDPTTAVPKTVVEVEEGEVLVEYAGGQSKLTASQSWTSSSTPSQPATAPAPATAEGAPRAPSPRSGLLKRRPETLAAETKLLRSGLASEQKGDLGAATNAFQALMSRYPDSQLAPDAKAALTRVQGRLHSSQ